MPFQPRPNRRQLLAGSAGALLASAVRPGSAPAATIPTDARPDVVHRGRAIAVTHKGRFVVIAQSGHPRLTITDRRTQKSRTLTLAGTPLEIAVSPNDVLIAVTTAFWGTPGVELLHVGARKPLQARLAAGPAPFLPVFTSDRKHLVLTGGEQDGTLKVLRAPDFAQGKTVPLGRVPRGLALTPGDTAAWVALQAEDALVRVDLRSGKVTHRIDVAPLPDRIALSKSGRRLLVSHGAHDVTSVSEIDTRTGHVGMREVDGRVSAVGWAGDKRIVVVPDAHQIVVLDAHGHRKRRTTIAAPSGLAISGGHAFVASTLGAEYGRVKL